MSIHVVARFTARPDSVDALRTLLLSGIEPTHKEAGCISYKLLHNASDPTDFTFVEEWADDAAFDAHLATPHLQVILERCPALIAADPDVRRYAVL